MKKYQIITRDIQAGFDEKQDCDNMNEAKEFAKSWLLEGYEMVYILTSKKVQRVYDRYYFSGRKPFSFENKMFHFEK